MAASFQISGVGMMEGCCQQAFEGVRSELPFSIRLAPPPVNNGDRGAHAQQSTRPTGGNLSIATLLSHNLIVSKFDLLYLEPLADSLDACTTR